MTNKILRATPAPFNPMEPTWCKNLDWNGAENNPNAIAGWKCTAGHPESRKDGYCRDYCPHFEAEIEAHNV